LDEAHLRLDSVVGTSCALHAYSPVDKTFCPQNPNAPVFVLIPGLGMDAVGFIRQLPLGTLAELHLFQTPNDRHIEEDGPDCFARHVEEYIRALKLEKRSGGIILGGCSMGGAVSLRFASRAKIKLRGLVLLGTFGNCMHLPGWQRMAAPLARLLPLNLARKVVHQLVARTSHFGRVTQSEAEWLVSCKLPHTRDYFNRAVMSLTRQNQLEAAALIKTPTLVLHGTDDKVLPHAAGLELSKTIPGSKMVTVPDSGHAFFFTHHEIINAAIAQFIDELTA